jgi:hypothetical protein
MSRQLLEAEELAKKLQAQVAAEQQVPKFHLHPMHTCLGEHLAENFV